MNTRTKLCFYAVFVVMLAEFLSRIFLGVHFHSKELFFHPERLWFHFYPMLRAELEPSKPKGSKDSEMEILFVGASVLAGGGGYGAVGPALEREFKRKGIPIRIHNMAAPAHTSLDAWWKFRALKKIPFDLIVYYEGFNEIRANNCPDEEFQNDYSHYGWYRRIHTLNRHPELGFSALAFVFDFLTVEIGHFFRGTHDVPINEPNPENLLFGNKIKTQNSLRINLENLLTLAKEKREPVVVGTQAFYVPNNYSRDRFHHHQLDYQDHLLPVELWGMPAAVIAGAKAHNEVLKSVVQDARGRGYDVTLIDLEAIIPHGKRYFNDVCHLTDEASQIFANQVIDSTRFIWKKRLSRSGY